MSFIMKNIEYSPEQEHKTFTLNEVNDILPEIEECVYRLMQMNAQVNQIINKLKHADMVLSDSIIMDNLRHQDEDSINNLSSLKVLLSAIQDELNNIATNGGIVNNIDDGIVNWHGIIGENTTVLSWKLGEKSVGYYQKNIKCKKRVTLDALELDTSKAS